MALLHHLPLNLLTTAHPKVTLFSLSKSLHAGYSLPRVRRLGVLAATNKDIARSQTPAPGVESKDEISEKVDANGGEKGIDLGWLPSFPHVLTASMSNFLFGYHIGVTNGPIVSIAQELGFEGNTIVEGLVVSIFIAGAFIGSLACGYLVDTYGCRRTLQIVTVPLIIGAILSGQAHSVEEILWGRFLVGLGIGVNTVLVPIYISEVAPTKYRGSLGSVCQLGTCLGIIASLFIAIPSEYDPHWWRMMLYIASIPGFLLALGMQFAVESPRWLCKAGRLEDAKYILNKLWGASEVDKAIEEFQLVIKRGQNDLDSRWLELLEEPHSKVAFIGGALFFLQQFAGINGVLYFSSLTFKDVGIQSASLASLFVGLTNFAGALTALYLIDKQGRRRLLIGSYLGMAITMFLIVYSISFPLDEELGRNLSVFGTLMYTYLAQTISILDTNSIGRVFPSILISYLLSPWITDYFNMLFFSIFRYIFTFALGAGPVTGLIIPELSSNRLRGKIMGLSFSVHWVCNFIVGLFFLELVRKFGVALVYASFGVVSLVSAIFAYYMVVETKGRSLEEIEMSLRSEFSSGDN